MGQFIVNIIFLLLLIIIGIIIIFSGKRGICVGESEEMGKIGGNWQVVIEFFVVSFYDKNRVPGLDLGFSIGHSCLDYETFN